MEPNTPDPPDVRPLLTIGDVSARLDIDRSTARKMLTRLVERGKIPAPIPIGRRVKAWPRESLEPVIATVASYRELVHG